MPASMCSERERSNEEEEEGPEQYWPTFLQLKRSYQMKKNPFLERQCIAILRNYCNTLPPRSVGFFWWKLVFLRRVCENGFDREGSSREEVHFFFLYFPFLGLLIPERLSSKWVRINLESVSFWHSRLSQRRRRHSVDPYVASAE